MNTLNVKAIGIALGLSILVSASCSGCASTNLTPFQRKALNVTAVVLVVGAIAAHKADHGGDPITNNGPDKSIQPVKGSIK